MHHSASRRRGGGGHERKSTATRGRSMPGEKRICPEREAGNSVPPAQTKAKRLREEGLVDVNLDDLPVVKAVLPRRRRRHGDARWASSLVLVPGPRLIGGAGATRKRGNELYSTMPSHSCERGRKTHVHRVWELLTLP